MICSGACRTTSTISCDRQSDDSPQSQRRHQQRDQHIVAGERQAEKSPLHFVAADHLDGVEALQQGAGAAEIADRPGAIGRPLEEMPFDAGMVGAEPGIAERRQRQQHQTGEQRARETSFVAASAVSAPSGIAR